MGVPKGAFTIYEFGLAEKCPEGMARDFTCFDSCSDGRYLGPGG